MRLALEGNPVNPQAPPPAILSEYRLAKLFGWTPQQIDDAPGHWCDWALAISKVEDSIRRG